MINDLRAALMSVLVLVIGCATVFSWVSPNHYYPWTTFHAQLAAAVAASLVAFAVFFSSRAQTFQVPRVAVITFAVAFIPWLQFAGGVISFLGDALIASLFLALFALTMATGFQVVAVHGLRKLFEPLAWLIVIGALLSVWLALYQWQRLDYLFVFALELGPGHLPFANFAQPNQLGTLLVLGVVSCAYLYVVTRLGRWTSILLMAMLVFGIAMTGSRAALLQIICISVWLALSLRRPGPINLRSIAVVLALLVASLLLWPQLQTEGASIARVSGSVQAVGARPTHWLSMLDAASRAPWVGHGWNQVGAAQFMVATEYPATHETLGASHNLFVDLLVWNGLAMGALLCLVLITWFVAILCARQTTQSALAMAAVIGPFVHAMVEFPLHYMFFLLPTALLMGAVTAELRPQSTGGVRREFVIGALVATCVAGLATSFEYTQMESAMRAARFEAARIGLDGPRLPPVEAKLLTQHAAFIQFARTPEREGMSAAELRRMEQVMLRYPHSTVVVRYASALAKNKRPREAASALSRICKIRSKAECNNAITAWALLSKQSEHVAMVGFPPPLVP